MESPAGAPPRAPREPSTPDGALDGVTGLDDGGREDGDVELALFRRIRSLSNVAVSGRIAAGRAVLRGPPAPASAAAAGYRRYFKDPLGMFGADAPTELRQGDVGAEVADAPDGLDVKEQSRPQPQRQQQSEQQGQALADDDDDGAIDSCYDSRDIDNDDQFEQNDTSTPDHALQKYVANGIAWRDAMVQACADLLGLTIPELQRDYNATIAATPPNTAFPEARSFEPTPRDLADFAIMTTLKQQDAFAMQNATSWLFNMMDRTGAGYVLRDEFVRYAPFIGPVADAAVAGLVFDELLLEQARRATAAETLQAATIDERTARQRSRRAGDNARDKIRTARNGLRKRRTFMLPAAVGSSSASSATSSTTDLPGPEELRRAKPQHDRLSSDASLDAPRRDLYPPAAALKFDMWRSFFLAIQDKYSCQDDDWSHVKQQLGIDSGEILIKSQGALDHSDVFPTLGKLYLSQRYLIFHAAVGRNHYVARLGAIAELSKGCIPIMMRDVMKVHLESEVKAAIDGVSAKVSDIRESSSGGSSTTRRSEEPDQKQDPMLSEQVGKLMRQFTSGRKPLVFSLLEFRVTKRRDNWLNLTQEMVKAHKLHVQLGFGSSGRALPSFGDNESSGDITKSASQEGISDNDKANQERRKIRTLNYARSPFRNEPSPPLLAVAAHGNIIRYRALRRVTAKRVSHSLLIFSHAERNTRLVNWYTDSVRAYDNWGSRSWIERALAAIRDNMETHDRIYHAQDEEPFDIGKLGDEIGRLAQLCSPVAKVAQLLIHLFQWRNPPATILAILACLMIAVRGWVHYVPACLVFLQAAWIVETKYNWLGLGMGRTGTEDAERRQANVLALVAQVHDTLAAAQNVLARVNRALGKVESLILWGSEEWQSWVVVGALCGLGLVLLIIPARILFVWVVFFLFFKYFLPPSNAGMKFWASVPSRMKERNGYTGKPSLRRKRKVSMQKPPLNPASSVMPPRI